MSARAPARSRSNGACAHRRNRAFAVEARPDRAARTGATRGAGRAATRRWSRGGRPAALAGLPPPDAVFIGGGLTDARRARGRLGGAAPGGRLVANAVTLDTQARLLGRAALRRHAAPGRARAAGPVGTLHALRPALPVMQWAVVKP